MKFELFYFFILPNGSSIYFLLPRLTVEDAYYEEKIGGLIDDLLLQVHMLGGGIIGQAAFTKKHWWMFSDSHFGGENPLCPSPGLFQDDSEFHRQFSSGIKTIAVISVEPRGVVQFGSTEKILERAEIVNQTKKLFQEIENGDGLGSLESVPSSSNSQNYGPNGLFASLISSQDSYFTDSLGPTSSSTYTSQSFTFTSDHKRMPLSLENSSHSSNYLQGSNAQALFNQSNAQLEQQPLPQFASNPVNMSTANPSCNVFSARPDSPFACRDIQNFHDSTFNSLNGIGVFTDTEKTSPSDIFNMQDFIIPEELFQNGDNTDLFRSCSVDNFSQWFAPSPDHSNITVATAQNDGLLSQAMGLTSINVSANQSTNSLQSSITNGLSLDAKGKCLEISCIENDLFGSTSVNFGCRQAGDLGDILMPVINDFCTYNSECISNQHVNGSTFGPRKGLFSKLGIEELLEGVPGSSPTVSTSCIEDQVSSTTKRRRTGNSLWDLSYLQPVYNSFGPKKDVIPKLEQSLWMRDGYSLNSGSTVSQVKRNVEPAKTTKKKAKPGARPRPKDRQQILDRMAELRELIPNGEKLSIDCLLDRTIKHMLFLQSVTKHADRLKQVDEAKVNNGMVQKDYSGNSSGNGVTWACELGDQTVICPLIVEDLSTHGQMLIEMLCEEQGFFLEIVDVIRGFGLTILKGVMETRADKIWARFIVEAQANMHVTRHEIFSALVQLLQVPAASDHNKVLEMGTSLLNNYQQSSLAPLPVSLAETLQCINL